MRAEGLRHGIIREARLRDSLVARCATVDNIHSRKPDLIDVGAVVGEQLFRVWTRLSKPQVRTLVLLPLATKILERRNREHRQERKTGNRKDQTRAIGQLAHVFSRHESSKATPRTSRDPGKKCQPPLGRERRR